MAQIYIRSALWLIGLGGLGYGLLQLTPDNRGTSNLFNEKYNTNLTEEQKKKQLILEKLKESANSTPIYLKKDSGK